MRVVAYITILMVARCSRTALDQPASSHDGSSSEAQVGDGGSSCHPIPNPSFPGNPLPDAADYCRAWAQSLTASGYGRSAWANGCTLGDDCYVDPVTGQRRCSCGGAFCAGDQVCVSDTATGPETCRMVCVPDCPAGCSATECFCKAVDDVCYPNGRVCIQQIAGGSCKGACPDAG